VSFATNPGATQCPLLRSHFPLNEPIDSSRVWNNVADDGQSSYSVTFDHRYVDQKGDWQSSSSFGSNDLLVLAKLADLCKTHIYELHSADNERSDERSHENQSSATRRKALAVKSR